jgi:hypothetical protein
VQGQVLCEIDADVYKSQSVSDGSYERSKWQSPEKNRTSDNLIVE